MTTVLIPVYNEVTQLDFTALDQLLSMVPDINVIVASIGGAPGSCRKLRHALRSLRSRLHRGDRRCTLPVGRGRRLCNLRLLGSLILGVAGLLKARSAACHWAWRDMLTSFGAIPDAGRVVRDGNIITGDGVTACADFSLALIAELRGPDVAQSVQLALEYAPAPPFEAGRPEIAPAISALP